MSKHSNISIFIPHIGCPHRCSFCNQNTITGQARPPQESEVYSACDDALNRGIDIKNTEIAFFGGSFTAIPEEYMLRLLKAAKKYVDMGFAGIRLSTRPDCISEKILDTLAEYGVTSIELGAQSMSDDVLEANGRGHTALDTENASRLVKSYGFTLGLQMMVGLYKSTPETDRLTAKRIISLSPDEVRIYPVVVLRDTYLGKLYLSGEYRTYDIACAAELCAELLDMFESKGIRVIKLGLHASEEVESSMLGGIYHPAFREMCEAVRFRTAMENMLKSESGKDFAFTVKPSDLSKAVGQHRSNISYFKEKGINITVKPCKEQTERLRILHIS